MADGEDKVLSEEPIVDLEDTRKICPFMAQGLLSNPSRFGEKLPRCERKGCACWIDEGLMTTPGCGLVRPA